MDRKAIANETLHIIEQSWYEYEGRRVEIAKAQRHFSHHGGGCRRHDVRWAYFLPLAKWHMAGQESGLVLCAGAA